MTADTYSSILGVLLMGTGNDNNIWGSNANASVFQALESAIAGTATHTVTGGTLDLSASGSNPPNAASLILPMMQVFNGALTSQQVVQIPNLCKVMLVNNATSGNYSLGIKTASGSTCYVRQGSWALVWCNGSDSVRKTYVSGVSALPGKIVLGGTPVLCEGELSCDGTAYSRTSDKIDLFNALSIQQTGSRTSGQSGISSLSDTSNIKVGFYASGTGIAASATVITVVDATTVVLSGVCTSSGSNTVTFSPYPLGDGATTFNVPNLTDTGRFLRAATSTVPVGTAQSNAVGPHTHIATGASTTTTTAVSTTTSGAGSTTTVGTSITDPGHSHATSDPGHSHTMGGAVVGFNVLNTALSGAGTNIPINAAAGSIQAATTGLSITSAQTSITATSSASTTTTVSSSTTTTCLSSTTTLVTVNANTGTTETRPEAAAVLATIAY